MRLLVVALVLLVVQQLGWRSPVPREHEDPLDVISLLDGATTTSDSIAIAGRVVDVAPTFGDGVRLTLDLEAADEHAASGLVSVSIHETERRWHTGDRVALRSRLRRVT